MAPFVPAPGTIQVDLRFRLDDQWISNTFYASRFVGNVTQADLLQLANITFNWYNTIHRNQCTTSLVLNEIYLRNISAQNGIVWSYTTGLPLAGTLTGQTAPNNVTFTISFRTGFAGKSYRGRVYHPGIRLADIASAEPNNLVPARAQGLVGSWETLRQNIASGMPQFRMAVVSRYANKAPRTSAEVTEITSVLAVDRVLDSQRRRLPKRGV